MTIRSNDMGKHKRKSNAGTVVQTVQAGSTRKPTPPAERENRAWSLCMGRPRILGKRKLIDLNRELQAIIDNMPVFMPDVKADVVRLCEQAEIGRRCLRDHHDQSGH